MKRDNSSCWKKHLAKKHLSKQGRAQMYYKRDWGFRQYWQNIFCCWRPRSGRWSLVVFFYDSEKRQGDYFPLTIRITTYIFFKAWFNRQCSSYGKKNRHRNVLPKINKQSNKFAQLKAEQLVISEKAFAEQVHRSPKEYDEIAREIVDSKRRVMVSNQIMPLIFSWHSFFFVFKQCFDGRRPSQQAYWLFIEKILDQENILEFFFGGGANNGWVFNCS